MPIRDDLILRMLDQIAAVVARVVLGATSGATEEAERVLSSAYQELTGSNRELVAQLGTDQLLSILGAPLNFNRERGYVLARLLEADAEVRSREAADPAAVEVARLKALDLYLASEAAELYEEDLEDRIAGMKRALAEVFLPLASTWRLFDHERRHGRFAAAEDLLFELLERQGPDAELSRRGRAFYRDLAELPDQALEAGALPREEVREGQGAFEAAVAPASTLPEGAAPGAEG